jgi:drug/metabolite transporter (DMT)-like permease
MDDLATRAASNALARRGAVYGLLAAALFGLSAPIAKLFLAQAGPHVLAGLLYLGAWVGLSLFRIASPATDEAALKRSDVPALAGVVISGGVLGPLLMLIGLQRVSAVAGSLLLNLEGPFTMGLAVLFFREHLGRYGVAAAALVLIGAALLKFQPGHVAIDSAGAVAIAAACLCWAVDNNLTQRLSVRNPFTIVRIKAWAAGTFNLALGLALGDPLPKLEVIAGAMLLGTLSYGASVVLDAYALRILGAAREAAYFATAPFVGALAATFIVGENLRPLDALAMLVMGAGVVALLRERHSHRHTHEPLDHTHLHTHDEHHRHLHAPDDPPGEPHAHAHHHATFTHDHPHVPDIHHRHRH